MMMSSNFGPICCTWARSVELTGAEAVAGEPGAAATTLRGARVVPVT
jgi:hypothetical protein